MEEKRKVCEAAIKATLGSAAIDLLRARDKAQQVAKDHGLEDYAEEMIEAELSAAAEFWEETGRQKEEKINKIFSDLPEDFNAGDLAGALFEGLRIIFGGKE